jgi:hypothetical protein
MMSCRLRLVLKPQRGGLWVSPFILIATRVASVKMASENYMMI